MGVCVHMCACVCACTCACGCVRAGVCVYNYINYKFILKISYTFIYNLQINITIKQIVIKHNIKFE